MKIKLDTKSLQDKLAQANRFTAGKNTSNLLSGIYLEALETQHLLLRTSTGAVIYETTLPAEVSEIGIVVVPGDLFTSLIKSLQTGEVILEQENEVLKISQGRFKSQVATLPHEAFESMNLDQLNIDLVLPVQQFVEHGQRVMVSASTDETKPVLTSLVLETKQPNAIVATDGFRLFRVEIDLSLDVEGNFLLPAKVLKDFLPILEKSDLKTVVCKTNDSRSLLFFDLGDTKLQMSAISGEFPNYQAIIPQNVSFSYLVDKEELTQRIQQAMIFAKEMSSIVIFSVEGTELIVESQENTKGQSKAQVECQKIDGQPEKFACNGRYVLDFLQSMAGNTVQVQGNDSLKPVLFSDADNLKEIYLIMPFKI